MTPILTERSFDVISHSASQTFRIGECLGGMLQSGDVICLQGNLGMGKTCFTQGIGRGLAVEGVINSPTFVYISEHAPSRSGPYLYHVDLYRIQDYTDAFALGLEEYMYGDGVTVIEWAERAQEIIPSERLWVTLDYLDYTKRSLIFEATGDRYLALLKKLRTAVFGAS